MANTFSSLLDMVYPTEAYYLSHTSTTPSSLFGGSWVTLSPAVVRTSDNTDTGGVNETTHYHWTAGGTYGSESAVYLMNGDNAPFKSTIMSDRWWATFYTPTAKVQGMGRITSTTEETLNNLPVYQNCYGWYRTS